MAFLGRIQRMSRSTRLFGRDWSKTHPSLCIQLGWLDLKAEPWSHLYTCWFLILLFIYPLSFGCILAFWFEATIFALCSGLSYAGTRLTAFITILLTPNHSLTFSSPFRSFFRIFPHSFQTHPPAGKYMLLMFLCCILHNFHYLKNSAPTNSQ